ncbi:MAG: CopG family transcriptional regulator [Deltaproteobacteria bacterium]|nr:CopG family transcriptional regulator [Deltaproteobacteria bacterium]
MANIKTAISIDKPLFEEVDEVAHELNTSRSRVFSLAAQEFVDRHKNQKLLQAINEAYEDMPDDKEETLNTMRRSLHLRMVKEQW